MYIFVYISFLFLFLFLSLYFFIFLSFASFLSFSFFFLFLFLSLVENFSPGGRVGWPRPGLGDSLRRRGSDTELAPQACGRPSAYCAVSGVFWRYPACGKIPLTAMYESGAGMPQNRTEMAF